MAHLILSRCPLCGEETEATEVACPRCDVQVRGQFTLSRYDKLAPEQAQFLEAFLRCRGVLRDAEALLGVSYPTVRGRLDSLLETLGFAQGAASQTPTAESAQDTRAARRKEILAAISAGTMDAETGLNALQQL